ncbi:glycoside hydrolase family 2 protein [Occultella glacieicola]|uniref:glycoside hydrolase family 2 protein n=1 Tax=Occultella glacieicola TaxID=2518684 RepID=UPI001A9DAAB5|nr:sugar-binding domain-containing protein [Occultella glacieicola]
MPDGGGWPERIVVPFAWETRASGVERGWLDRATYRRKFEVPTAWAGSRTILRFGAVHHRATVFVNRTEVGSHEGGYMPFEFDVTDALIDGANELRVHVEAPLDKRFIPHSKQRSMPRDDYDSVAFTPSSGIWQTVWLESRPATAASAIRLRGESLASIEAEVEVTGPHAADARVDLRLLDDADSGPGSALVATPTDAGSFRASLTPDSPRLWSPADPHLYRVEVTVHSADGVDRVVATTGLRRVETKGDKIFLNDVRIAPRAVLDQGYWPPSGITARTDDALRRDLELAREAGYTMVRKHLRLEDPRWLHWADTLGMLVWEEPASTSRYSAAAIEAFEAQIPVMVARDGNHPSIVIWGLYNEEWGLDWQVEARPEYQGATARAYDLLAALGTTRPIVDDSGWSHVKTDIVDWHIYTDDFATWADLVAGLAGHRQDFPVTLAADEHLTKQLWATPELIGASLPILNSEYGAGHTSTDRGWQLKWQTQELRRHDAFSGYVYTELTDVEHEMADLYYADRTRKDLLGIDPAHVNAEAVVILDVVPVEPGVDVALELGALLRLPVRASHHGASPIQGTLHAGWAPLLSPWPEAVPTSAIEPVALTVDPFVVTEVVEVALTALEGTARLLLWLAVDDGTIVARSTLDLGSTGSTEWDAPWCDQWL